MDLKERAIQGIDKFLSTRSKSYLQAYARGDLEKNSKLLTNQFINQSKRSRLSHMAWTIIPDVYLAGGAFAAHQAGHHTIEEICIFGLGASFAYALSQGLLIISPYFFTNSLEEETRRVLEPLKRPEYSRPGVTPEL